MIMQILELIIIGLSLAMDAFSASICKGLNQHQINFKNSLIVALYFGLFQAIMPLIGYKLGNIFSNKVTINYYIAFFILLIIGITMIKDAYEEKNSNPQITFREMFFLSLATSIDALIVGISFAFLKTNIFFSILIIGIITFILSVIGYNFGTYIGQKYQKKAQIMGGIILIIMGFKILLEHLF